MSSEGSQGCIVALHLHLPYSQSLFLSSHLWQRHAMTLASYDMTWNSVCAMSVGQLWECHSDGGEFERDHPHRFLSLNDSLLCINVLHHTLLTRNGAFLTLVPPHLSSPLAGFRKGRGCGDTGWPLASW